MKSTESEFDPNYPIKVVRKEGYFLTTNSYFQRWAKVLTPVEYMVVESIKYCEAGTSGEVAGWWSIGRCQRLTGLNRKSIIRAIQKVRKYGLLIVEPRNGKSPNLSLLQDMEPPVSARRQRRNPLQNLGLTCPNRGSGTRPSVGTGPSPSVGTGTRPSVGTGPSPSVGTGTRPSVDPHPLQSIHPLQSRQIPDDDDDTNQAAPELAARFAEANITLDLEMAKIMFRDMRQMQPDITIAEIMALAHDRLEPALKQDGVKCFIPYLISCMVKIARGPAFDRIRAKLKANQEAENARHHRQEEIDRLVAERGLSSEYELMKVRAREQFQAMEPDKRERLRAEYRQALLRDHPPCKRYSDQRIAEIVDTRIVESLWRQIELF